MDSRKLFVVLFAALPILGCPKKTEVVDAGPAAVPTPVATPEPVDLKPLEVEDAGIVDAAPDVKKPTGPAVNANVARLKQCCGALGAQARADALKGSVEAGMVLAAAGVCNQLAAQAANGNAPELAPLRNAMKGKTMPPVCQGL
jgi:hypothetical protein